MQRQNQKTIGASRTMMINPRASLAGVDAANGQCWYEIRALSAGRVEIFLYDVIGGWGITAQQFVADCKEAGVFDASAVDLHIHSPGGDVMQGFAIYNDYFYYAGRYFSKGFSQIHIYRAMRRDKRSASGRRDNKDIPKYVQQKW